MHRQSHEMFDASTIPDDLSSIGTVLSPMLPGDWRNVRPVVDREKCVKCAVCWVYCPAQCIVEKPRWFDIDLAACKGLRRLRRRMPAPRHRHDRGGGAMSEVATAPRVVVCEGNEAAAIGVALARPDVVAVYPITPQSSLVEHLSQMIADGTLQRRPDESGRRAFGDVGAARRGAGRCAHLHRDLRPGPGVHVRTLYPRTRHAPADGVRAGDARRHEPQTVWGGQQDAMIVREAGWIQMYCETGQEVLDTVIMAYKIAENRDVVLPVNVCCDGNYLGYGVTRVEVPAQAGRRCVPAAAGRELARRAGSGAADGGGSADRRRRRHRPAHLRALSQKPVPRHAERAAGDRGRACRMGRAFRPLATRRWSRNTGSTMRNTRW